MACNGDGLADCPECSCDYSNDCTTCLGQGLVPCDGSDNCGDPSDIDPVESAVGPEPLPEDE